MKRKIWIATALVFASSLAAGLPLAAHASSPLLSGYGGPGAGEQAIIGSTLLHGPRGGSGAGGSASATGPGSGGSTSSPTTTGAGQASSAAGPSGGSSAAGGASASGRSLEHRGSNGEASPRYSSGASRSGSGSGANPAHAYVYPSAIASSAGVSSGISISATDVLLFIGIGATLGLIAVFTVRLVRLQP